MTQSKSLKLLKLDRAAYPNLSDKAFTLLSRIAFLSNGSTDPVPYPNAMAVQDLDCAVRTITNCVKELSTNLYISILVESSKRFISLTNEAKLEPAKVIETVATVESSNPIKDQDSKQPFNEHLFNLGYLLPRFALNDAGNFQNYINEPLLSPVRNNLLTFDLRPLVEAAGLTNFTPFGKPHSWQFDFTKLQEYLEPTNMRMELMGKEFPNYIGYHYRAPHYFEQWKEFFIFSLIIELSAGLGDCFMCQNKIDAFGSNFFDCWNQFQRGPLFACLNACYTTESGTYSLAKRITDKYSPAKALSILPYAQACIKNEVVELLSREETANLCFFSFRRAFVKYVESQEHVVMAHASYYTDYDWLSGAWDKKIAFNLLNYDSTYYTPRINWPLVLFRSLVSAYSLSGLSDGATESRQTRASIAIGKIFTGPNQVELLRFASDLAPYFPFFEQVSFLLKSFTIKENKFYEFDI